MSRREEAESGEIEEGRSDKSDERSEETSVLRVVAMMGRVAGVVKRRCRVSAWPIPREDGVTRAHAIAGVDERGRGREIEENKAQRRRQGRVRQEGTRTSSRETL